MAGVNVALCVRYNDFLGLSRWMASTKGVPDSLSVAILSGYLDGKDIKDIVADWASTGTRQTEYVITKFGLRSLFEDFSGISGESIMDIKIGKSSDEAEDESLQMSCAFIGPPSSLEKTRGANVMTEKSESREICENIAFAMLKKYGGSRQDIEAVIKKRKK